MQLDDLQSSFQTFVLEGAGNIAAEVVSTSHVPAATRLKVYTNAYHARLHEALACNYPVLAKLLDVERFGELARDYVEHRPPRHFSIRWYGEGLAQFMTAHPVHGLHPMLAELAEWEWSMTLAFDAADASPADRRMLQTLQPHEWEHLRLKPHPSVHLVTMRTRAPMVWRALNRNDAVPPQVPVRDSSTYVIWRRGLDTCYRLLETKEAHALAGLARGATFGQICELLAGEVPEPEVAGTAARLLARWLEDEMLTA